MLPPGTITSPSNPKVRQAAQLRAAAYRRTTGLTLVDGRREITRAVAAGVPVAEVFVTASAPPPSWLMELVTAGTPIVPLAPRAFEKVAFGDRDEGAVAVVRFAGRSLGAVPLPADRPVVVLEGVEKPGNLGAILRTVDAAGLGGVVACDPRTDVANPAVLRASLGTAFTVPIAVATVAETIAWCQAHRRRVVAAVPDGTHAWHEATLTGRLAILLGSEAHGISPAWRAAALAAELELESVRLPMLGSADSLNVSATAAVLAYEALRQGSATT
jgi:TrmH family RNA methyltransferase